MPADLPVLVLIAVAATAVAAAVLRRVAERDDPDLHPGSHAHRPGAFASAADIVDASIGMYMARRLLGRPTASRADGRAERAQIARAADEARGRKGGSTRPAAVAPTRLVVAGTAA